MTLILKRTPRVLGSNSVYCTMSKVKMREKTLMTVALPGKRALRLAPASAAPMVWAAVLMIRITARGLSISCFKLMAHLPAREEVRLSSASWLGEMLKSAASMSEQQWEKTIATLTLITK